MILQVAVFFDGIATIESNTDFFWGRYNELYGSESDGQLCRIWTFGRAIFAGCVRFGRDI